MDKPSGSPSCAENPESSSAPRKVGIITHWESEPDNLYEIRIYLLNVDLDSGRIQEFTRVPPAVRFRFPHTYNMHAVCLLNSTVYIFGGCSGFMYDAKTKSAHKFELSPEVFTQPDYPAQIGGELAEISLMKYPKRSPASLPTPDGSKIIVFSRLFCLEKSNRAFELYDPSGDFWEQLPPFPCHLCDSKGFPCSFCRGDKIHEVVSYSFVNDSHFYIVVKERAEYPQFREFALHLENRAWVNVGIPEPLCKDGYFVTVKGRYVLCSGWAYDYGDGPDGGLFARRDPYEGNGVRRGNRAPLSEFPPRRALFLDSDYEEEPPRRALFLDSDYEEECRRYRVHCIAPLRPVVQGEEDEACDTCVLQFDGADEARVLIDVCRTDLTTLDTSVTNCVRLCLGFSDGLFGVRVVSI